MARRMPNGQIRKDDIKRLDDFASTNGGSTPGGMVFPEDVRSNKMIGNPPQTHEPDRKVLDQMMEELKDVKVSEKTKRDSEQRRMDERMQQQLTDPSSTDEQREEARKYVDARRREILRKNAAERALRNADSKEGPGATNDQEPDEAGAADGIRKFAQGVMKSAKGMSRAASRRAAEAAAQARKVGDIDVSAYDYTNSNGKRVHVKRHKRKR